MSSPQVPCNGFSDIENLEGPEIFFEDELVCILNMEGRDLGDMHLGLWT